MLRNGISALALTLALIGAVPAEDFYKGAWSFLVSLWSADEVDRGLEIDPDGLNSDLGAAVDLDGLAGDDRGLGLDPNG